MLAWSALCLPYECDVYLIRVENSNPTHFHAIRKYRLFVQLAITDFTLSINTLSLNENGIQNISVWQLNMFVLIKRLLTATCMLNVNTEWKCTVQWAHCMNAENNRSQWAFNLHLSVHTFCQHTSTHTNKREEKGITWGSSMSSVHTVTGNSFNRLKSVSHWKVIAHTKRFNWCVFVYLLWCRSHSSTQAHRDLIVCCVFVANKAKWKEGDCFDRINQGSIINIAIYQRPQSKWVNMMEH